MRSILPKISQISRSPWQTQLAAVILVLASLILVVSTVSQLQDAFQLSKLDEQAKQVGNRSVVAVQGSSVKTILNAPIFGKQESVKAERINTTLKLSGIVNSGRPEERYVFIAKPNEEAKVYREGDEISNGLKIRKIFDDKVTLMRYGALETLYVDWEKIDNNNAVTRSTSFTSNSTRPTVTRPSTTTPTVSPSKVNREDFLQKMRERFKDSRFQGGSLGRFKEMRGIRGARNFD